MLLRTSLHMSGDLMFGAPMMNISLAPIKPRVVARSCEQMALRHGSGY